MQSAFAQHALTQCLPPQALKGGKPGRPTGCSAFQRASSAVEGRNGSLAQLHHHQRGLPKQPVQGMDGAA